MKIKEIIIVEGKNDTNTLQSYFECDTIETHGTHLSKRTLKMIEMANKKRGVIIDAGFAGYVHTDFGVFESAMKHDAKPDVISTDITRASAYKRGGRYGMTMCMSLARTLGMSEEEIFKCVTVNPARALGKENEWGFFRVNGTADLAVFEYTDEAFDMTDRAGNRVQDCQGYRCVLTISDGEVVYRR